MREPGPRLATFLQDRSKIQGWMLTLRQTYVGRNVCNQRKIGLQRATPLQAELIANTVPFANERPIYICQRDRYENSVRPLIDCYGYRGSQLSSDADRSPRLATYIRVDMVDCVDETAVLGYTRTLVVDGRAHAQDRTRIVSRNRSL